MVLKGIECYKICHFLTYFQKHTILNHSLFDPILTLT